MSVDTTSLGANSIIRNTVTNRNVLAPVLFSICTNNNQSILVDPDMEHDLNSTDVYQAVCLQNGQPVAATGATAGTAYICVGPDTAEKALEWMSHLNLLEVGRIVVMQFYLTQGVPNDINLGNTMVVSTFDHVQVQVNGAAAAAEGVLFPSGSCAGNRVMVEVSCVDNTPGSELVSFNILTGPSWSDCS